MRDANVNDPVLLIETDSMRANLISPLLDIEGIPYSNIGKMGVGFTMRAGNLLETHRFFVPYGAYNKARALIESALGEDSEIIAALQKHP